MMGTCDKNLPLSHQEEIDRLADRFEREFKAGEDPQIEDYLQQHPELRKGLLAELLAVELELRRSAGEQPTEAEYRDRFPDDGDLIGCVFAPSASLSSTMGHVPDTEVEEEEPVPGRFGRYEVHRVLGQGSFGVVYLAHDPQLDRPVALKVPRRKRFRSAEQVARFIEEARTAAHLKHPQLVAVYDVQEQDGLPYIVQELIEGQNLAGWAATNRPSFVELARVLVSVADALGYAHQQGLTHCDLKLANVLMDTAGQPHVADFGLAIHERIQPLRKGEIFGTPSTMAPEQVRGESHRLDGRTDIWAIGAMFYELLVGRRPFMAESREELFAEIQTHDPRPPRQIDRSVPRELERICLKCLSKRKTDRYTTTDDLQEDLLAWLETDTEKISATRTEHPIPIITPPDSSSTEPVKIVPKGLRSFDAEDADFFLDLLPGPRDRDGLPESIRFWKNRIEEKDPDRTFAVGLIYGPSGCGKSSLVKAGLLPRLGHNVLPIHVEAAANDTEVRILKELRKHIPRLPTEVSLPEVCADLRLVGAGHDRKVLIVIDQFEQWLHAHTELKACQLTDALRQCEGSRLQAILLVRDDFFASVHRLFQELECPLVEGVNYALVDQFDKDHARKVLIAFGKAYGKLEDKLSQENEEFLARAVDELAEENKVISVRLALYADMMKTRRWVPASIDEVERVGGVGVTFLEETFSAKTAPPPHLVHKEAIRRVLKALLPEAGTDIRGSMKSATQLRDASEYADNSKYFEELIRILDSELRLITPTDPEGLRPESENDTGSKYYQLTHDYLVPSLREWLTSKQKETRRGRAELKLENRSATWIARRDKRYLLSFREWVIIRLLTKKRNWTPDERTFLRFSFSFWAAPIRILTLLGRSCAVVVAALLVGLVLAGILIIEFDIFGLETMGLAEAYQSVAWIQATGPQDVRDGPRAVANAVRACELTGWKDPDAVSTLAAAYAEAGDFHMAITQQLRAMELVRKGGGSGRSANELAMVLQRYKTNQPLRDKREAVEAYRNLAWIQATGSAEVRNGDAAMANAKIAENLTHGRAYQDIKTIAAACAETGQFDVAVRLQKEAIELAEGSDDPELTRGLHVGLKRYKRGLPLRDYDDLAQEFSNLAALEQYGRKDQHEDALYNARVACNLSDWADATYVKQLAEIHADSGQRDDALLAVEEAITEAKERGHPDELLDELRELRATYQTEIQDRN